jgi:hypothetical protein
MKTKEQIAEKQFKKSEMRSMNRKAFIDEGEREAGKHQIEIVDAMLKEDKHINPIQLELAIAYLEMFKKEAELV